MILVTALALAQTACSLSSSSSHHLVISLPQGGFGAKSQGLAKRNSNYSMPSGLGDFNCIGVIVTGEGIAPMPGLSSCKANPEVMPRGLGQVAGLVPASGGTIDLMIQGGSDRLIQLVGVQSHGGCPDVASVLSDAGSTAPKFDLGEPFMIGQTHADIFGDQSIEIKASFDPLNAKPMFSCQGDHGGHFGPPVLSNLDLYPHYTSGPGTAQFRVTGLMQNGDGQQVALFADANCTTKIANTSSSGGGETFTVTVNNASAAVPDVYVMAVNNAGSTPCTRVPGSGFQYGGGSTLRLNFPSPGMALDSTLTAIAPSGNCDSMMMTGTISMTMTDTKGATATASCGCSSNMFTTCTSFAVAPMQALADGPIKVSALGVHSSYTADDGFYVFKDSQAPGLAFTAPTQGTMITQSNEAAVTFSGTCGVLGEGKPVYLKSGGGSGSPSLPIATATCTSGAWSAVANVTSLPEGNVFVNAELEGPALGHRSYAGVSLIKAASIVNMFNQGGSNTSYAEGLARDSASRLFAVGTGGVAGNFYGIVRVATGNVFTPTSQLETQVVAGKTTDFHGVAIDGLDKVYAVGTYQDASYINYWHVQVSTDHGATWSGAGLPGEAYQLFAGSNAEARAAATDSLNNVYVVGYANGNGTSRQWIVRKWNGSTWTTVDAYSYATTAHDSEAYAVAIDSSNNIYVGGYGNDVSNHPVWIVRRSTDMGATWSNLLDTYNSNSDIVELNPSAGVERLTGLAYDNGSGTLYAAGYYDYAGIGHWIVKKYASGGWQAVDDFTPSPDNGGLQSAHANAAFVAGGTLFVGGMLSNSSPGYGGYIVRQYGGTVTNSFIPLFSGNMTGMGVGGLYVDANGVFSGGSIQLQGSQQTWIVNQHMYFTP